MKTFIDEDFHSDDYPIDQIVIKLLINDAPVRIVGMRRLMYNADLSDNELEDQFYTDVVASLDYFATIDGRYFTSLLSLYKFSNPEVYDRGVYIETNTAVRLPYIKNVNRRKLQYVLNRQYATCNFPEDTAVFDKKEWINYGGM